MNPESARHVMFSNIWIILSKTRFVSLKEKVEERHDIVFDEGIHQLTVGLAVAFHLVHILGSSEVRLYFKIISLSCSTNLHLAIENEFVYNERI